MNKSILAALFFLTLSNAFAEKVNLTITNLNRESGQIALAIYNDASSFPDDGNKAFKTKFISLNGTAVSQVVTLDLPAGEYAIAAFVDNNKNQKLDKNLIGAPKERFGFSKNPAIHFSAPTFSECVFQVTAKKINSQTINMIKFF